MLIGICLVLKMCKQILNSNWDGVADTILMGIPLVFLGVLEFGCIELPLLKMIGLIK